MWLVGDRFLVVGVHAGAPMRLGLLAELARSA